jgi:hypothetical protein
MATKETCTQALHLIVVSLSLFVQAAISQTAQPASNDNLYARGLQASILEMEKQWGHLRYGPEEGLTPDYRHMMVQKDPIITDKLPAAFENHTIEYLDDAGLISRYHQLDKSFMVLRIAPISNDGNTLKVTVSTYWFSYKKHRLLFGYSDWSEVEFRFDCKADGFVISSVKLGGI